MVDRSPSPGHEHQGGGPTWRQMKHMPNPPNATGPWHNSRARCRAREDRENGRTRSPTPRGHFPKYHREGVAFTEEDVTFLVRFMEFKKFVLVSKSKCDLCSYVLPNATISDALSLDCGQFLVGTRKELAQNFLNSIISPGTSHLPL